MTEIPIAKWGNSSAIRLPKALMEALELKQGRKLQITDIAQHRVLAHQGHSAGGHEDQGSTPR